MQLLIRIKIFRNWVSTLRRGATEYRTRNQVKIFCIIQWAIPENIHTHLMDDIENPVINAR